MEKVTKYVIEESLAKAITKITGKIMSIDFSRTYGLDEKEEKLIHEFYDLVENVEE